MDKKIRCDCGRVLFGPADEKGEVYILKSVAVAQFASGRVNLRCRNCKRWVEDVDEAVFKTKEEK